jgi:hypothetical protein
MAIYFSWDFLRSRFQIACREAERSSRKIAAIGIYYKGIYHKRRSWQLCWESVIQKLLFPITCMLYFISISSKEML